MPIELACVIDCERDAYENQILGILLVSIEVEINGEAHGMMTFQSCRI